MSVDVLREVFHHSRSKGTTRCVLVTLAEAAHHDGVTWLPLAPPRNGRRDPKCIMHRANCSKRQAIRSIEELAVELGEVEIRKAQRGQRRISVYRVVVGAIGEVEVDYERLPFELDKPFVRGAKLAPRSEPGSGVDEVPEAAATRGQDGTRRGDGPAPREVTASSRARVNRPSGAEPSEQPSAVSSEDPSAAGTEDQEESRLHDPAAAALEQPPSREVVKRVCEQLRGCDSGTVSQIEPVAASLPRGVFLEIATTVEQRCRSGNVGNPVGLLRRLLEIALAERMAALQEALMRSLPRVQWRESWTDQVKRETPDAYVRLMAKHLDDGALDEALPAGLTDTLRQLAANVRAGVDTEPARLPETATQARCRWIDEHAAQLDDADVAQVIDGWDDVDGSERALFHERAEHVRTTAAAAAGRESEAA